MLVSLLRRGKWWLLLCFELIIFKSRRSCDSTENILLSSWICFPESWLHFLPFYWICFLPSWNWICGNRNLTPRNSFRHLFSATTTCLVWRAKLVVLAIVYFFFMCCSFTQPSPSSFSCAVLSLDPLPSSLFFCMHCIDSFTLIRLAVSDINHRLSFLHVPSIFQLKIP